MLSYRGMWNVPVKEGDGRRRYGIWAGAPSGKIEDATRCVFSVPSTIARGMVRKQCDRKRGFGPDAEFCKQHAKIVSDD